MKFFHVDVFSSRPLSGNGLTVVFPEEPLSEKILLEITREFKQFETIFIYPINDDGHYPIRIFTVDEELMFAGHPIVGAGAVIHKLFFLGESNVQIVFELGGRHIKVHSSAEQESYRVTMNQGKAIYVNKVDKSYYNKIAKSINVKEWDIDENYPIEVVSTGLPYLLVPLKNNISLSKIVNANFESFLSAFEAKFVYVFDTKTLECRTWDNFGNTEDIATGSAAGPLCAYLVNNKMKKQDEMIDIYQGKFVNRPSIIQGWVSQNQNDQQVFIMGEVSFFASGSISI